MKLTVFDSPAFTAVRVNATSCFAGRDTFEPGYEAYSCTTSSPSRVPAFVTSTPTATSAVGPTGASGTESVP